MLEILKNLVANERMKGIDLCAPVNKISINNTCNWGYTVDEVTQFSIFIFKKL